MVVKQDQKGVYITHGDNKVRPQVNQWNKHLSDTKTVFKPGDKVKKYHHGGSTLVTVSAGDTKERWFIHERWFIQEKS